MGNAGNGGEADLGHVVVPKTFAVFMQRALQHVQADTYAVSPLHDHDREIDVKQHVAALLQRHHPRLC